jgi:hypothetical protein
MCRSNDFQIQAERQPHVVGVGRDRDNQIVVLLDEDDKATRAKLKVLAINFKTPVIVRVVGEIVT